MTMLSYEDFLRTKVETVAPAGFRAEVSNPHLFPFQRATVEWALERGRAAIFADCGMGKTAMQLEWASEVARHTGRPVLILTPLAVAGQTLREAEKFGIEGVVYAKDNEASAGARIVLTNYERVGKFVPARFGGVVLDESSILKSFMGKTKRLLLSAFADVPYRLACTATPLPNDHMELGNHSEFLGVLASNEMLTRWFINDTSSFGTYRLKGHAVAAFWDWVSSWGRCAGRPSDLGPYSDEGYILPELEVHRHLLEVDVLAERGGQLFRSPDMSATAVHKEKRRSAEARAARVGQLVGAESSEPWLVWCDTDYEADALVAVIPDAVDVRGSHSVERKERDLLGFAAGMSRVLITKPSLAGYGLNFQHCARVAFIGPTYSFEQHYQAIRRTWRFGQKRRVQVHVAMATTEVDVWAVLMRKAEAHESMKLHMFEAVRRAQARESVTFASQPVRAVTYAPTVRARLPEWLESA